MYSWKTRMAKTAAAVLAGTLALSGCGVGTGTTNAKGGPSVADTITAQVAYSSRDFNPLSTSMALPMAGNWHVTEALYTLQMSDYSLVSGLAAGEPEKISDTEYVITIRDGAKFSDGNAVTANDVKTSFERVMAPDGVYAPMLSFIDSITAQGDNKIDFKLKYAFT
ncbi:ABC transporter substrate-binding protein, partial [Bifidobacterium breve]